MTIIMSDTALDRWAEIYRANAISKRLPGMTFEKFLLNPEAYLQAACFNMQEPVIGDCDGDFPLLPAQREICGRLYEDELMESMTESIEAELKGGIRHRENRFIEPMRHRSYAATSARDGRRIRR